MGTSGLDSHHEAQNTSNQRISGDRGSHEYERANNDLNQDNDHSERRYRAHRVMEPSLELYDAVPNFARASRSPA